MHMLRRWFFGHGEYAHPALRWASWPLFRIAVVVFVVILFAGGTRGGATPWKIGVLALLVVSLIAGLTNDAVLWSRRRGRPSRTSS